MPKIENLKFKITPVNTSAVKQMATDIMAGKDVDTSKIDLTRAKLRLELDSDIATLQDILKHIKALGKSVEK